MSKHLPFDSLLGRNVSASEMDANVAELLGTFSGQAKALREAGVIERYDVGPGQDGSTKLTLTLSKEIRWKSL